MVCGGEREGGITRDGSVVQCRTKGQGVSQSYDVCGVVGLGMHHRCTFFIFFE